MKILVLILFLCAGAMAYEEPPFNIVHKTDVYEIRHYKDRLAVQAIYNNQDSSFRKLFNYISGANTNSEKIKMTIPVTEFKESTRKTMQFYLPSKFTKGTAPTPTDPNLEIIIISEGYYAVIKYSGRITDKNFNKHKENQNNLMNEPRIHSFNENISNDETNITNDEGNIKEDSSEEIISFGEDDALDVPAFIRNRK